MRCQCCECECEHSEPPEPEEHDVIFKGHDINVSKDSQSANWYIRVIHPNGSMLYDGWWRDSENAKWQEAVEEAKRGAMLAKSSEAASAAQEGKSHGAQGDKLLTVAERNIRSFLRSATFKSESDREAALNCVDVLWEAARAPADSALEDAARCIRRGQHWSVIDSIGNELRAEALDTAIDAASKQGANHD